MTSDKRDPDRFLCASSTNPGRRNRARFQGCPRPFRRRLLDLLHAHKRQHGTEIPLILRTKEDLAALTFGRLQQGSHPLPETGPAYLEKRAVEVAPYDFTEVPPEGKVWAIILGRYAGVRIGVDCVTEGEAVTDWWQQVRPTGVRTCRWS